MILHQASACLSKGQQIFWKEVFRYGLVKMRQASLSRLWWKENETFHIWRLEVFSGHFVIKANIIEHVPALCKIALLRKNTHSLFNLVQESLPYDMRIVRLRNIGHLCEGLSRSVFLSLSPGADVTPLRHLVSGVHKNRGDKRTCWWSRAVLSYTVIMGASNSAANSFQYGQSAAKEKDLWQKRTQRSCYWSDGVKKTGRDIDIDIFLLCTLATARLLYIMPKYIYMYNFYMCPTLLFLHVIIQQRHIRKDVKFAHLPAPL